MDQRVPIRPAFDSRELLRASTAHETAVVLDKFEVDDRGRAEIHELARVVVRILFETAKGHSKEVQRHRKLGKKLRKIAIAVREAQSLLPDSVWFATGVRFDCRMEDGSPRSVEIPRHYLVTALPDILENISRAADTAWKSGMSSWASPSDRASYQEFTLVTAVVRLKGLPAWVLVTELLRAVVAEERIERPGETPARTYRSLRGIKRCDETDLRKRCVRVAERIEIANPLWIRPPWLNSPEAHSESAPEILDVASRNAAWKIQFEGIRTYFEPFGRIRLASDTRKE